MRKESFFQGTLILAISGFFNRILGFILRIFLARYIGDEGLGLFQMVYPLFITLLIISGAGFPLALTKHIPEKLSNNNTAGVFRLFKITLIVVTLLSTLMTGGLLISANFLATTIFKEPRVYYTLLILAPNLVICSLSSAFKSFFQGFQIMKPTAIARTVEQINRFLATLVIINLVSSLALKYQAAGISLGIITGEITGLIILIYLFTVFCKNANNKFSQIQPGNYSKHFRDLSKIALPVTLGRIINSLIMSLEAILIPRQLQSSGLSIQEATSLYGQLGGMVQQIIFLPTVITIALTTSLLPGISRAYAQNNLKKIRNNHQDILRIVTYLGFPLTLIFLKYGKLICDLLFSLPEAGTILAGLALSCSFIYYLQISAGMLNGLGKPRLALRNLTVGSLLKLSGIYYLVPIPRLQIQGATLAITAGYILTALLNYFSLSQITGYQLQIKQIFLKPLLATGIVYRMQPYLETFIPNYLPGGFKVQTLTLLILNILLYLFIMVVLKAITPQDFNKFNLLLILT